ncbi:MAG TPA: glycine cleavage system protein GcvH [Acidimicrobiales bacterium]|jgi:glycine cleavage system H protein
MDVPDGLQYSSDHEWARQDAGRVRVGITDFAQDALGDIVFVDLPAVGDRVIPGQALGEVESTKSVSEVYAPVAGTVVAVNADLSTTPEHMNEDPYGAGWICEIEVDDATSVDALLSAEAYRRLTES